MAYPTWRCDCESGPCEDAGTHKPGSCKNTAPNVVLAFGMKQSLCDHCLEVAEKNFPNDVERI